MSMQNQPQRRSRRAGFQLVMLALGAGLATFALALAGATRSQSSRRQVGHLESRLEQRDLMASALEEAFHELSTAANDPGDERYEHLRTRSLADRELELAVPYTRERALEESPAEALEVHARVESRTPSYFDRSALPEWRGHLVLSARMGSSEQGVAHEIRAARVGAPAPFDEECYYDYRMGDGYSQDNPTTFAPGSWESRATLRIDSRGPGGVNAAWSQLRQELDTFSGVLLVDNAPHDPFELEDLRIRGRLLLVVRGPAEVVNVGPEDPSRDALTLVTLGDVTLSGDVRARVVLGQETGAPDPERELALGLSIRGALAVTSASYVSVSDVDLLCEERPFEGEVGRQEPTGLHVSLSPDAVGGWSE